MVKYDVIIIGGGAAGLSAAQYAARGNHRTLLIERTAAGGQCNVINSLENYPGFPEPIDGDEFSERFETQARSFGAEITIEDVESLSRQDDGTYLVRTDSQLYGSPVVILATGAVHRRLGVPGEEEFSGRGVSYCATCDGPMFAGKPMLVVGGGDAACDEATFLSGLTDRVIMIHRRDTLRAQGALAERVLNNPRIEVRFDTVLESIGGAQNEYGIDAVSEVTLRNVKTGETTQEPVGAVFVFIGSDPATDLVPFVDKDDQGYLRTDELMESSSPGLYAVGDVRNTPFRQLVVAAADGAIAAHAAGQRLADLAAAKRGTPAAAVRGTSAVPKRGTPAATRDAAAAVR